MYIERKRIIVGVGILALAVLSVQQIAGKMNATRSVDVGTVEKGYGVWVAPMGGNATAETQPQIQDALGADSGVITDKRAVHSNEESNATVTTPRLVIKTGQLSLVVKNVSEAIQKISAFVSSKDGFIVSSQVSKSGVAPYGSITIRIPVAVYDSGFIDIKSLGEVQTESTTGQDVTDQYVDLTSHVKNLQATEAQLLEIMKRAGKISDVLDVQEQLTDVRGEIERIQGQMKYLKDSAQMSSLTVYLATDPSQLPVVQADTDTWKPWAEFKTAVRNLLEIGKTISYGIIWLVVYIPLWLLFMGVIWVIVKGIKRVLFRRTNTTEIK